MRCHDVRIAVSARLDGEDPGLPAEVVDDHLGGCPGCRAHARDLMALHRSVRLKPAEAMPDLTPAVLHAIGREAATPGRLQGLTGMRLCLVVIGLVQLGVALPALLLGDDAGLPVHTARHIGSFAAALAVGFLVVAWKPERASGLLPVALALVAFLVGTTGVDLVSGHTKALGETGHITEVVGLLLTWMLARASQAGGLQALRRRDLGGVSA